MILCANPAAQYQSYRTEIEAAVLRVLRSNRYIVGPEVEALEQEFAGYIGVGDAIGVANGTDALELALRALDIGSGDEVITVSHTAAATVAAIEAAGAVPVLVDVDSHFYTLDPGQLAEVLTPRTRAVIAVHLYGQAAILRIKLRHLDADNGKRQQLAAHYTKLLFGQPLHLPAVRENTEHVFHLYVVRADNRQNLMDYLKAHDIHAGVHYPMPVHFQPAYKGRIRTARSMEVTERLSKEVLSLPMYPELSLEMADRVVAAVKGVK